jgi:hypothetical protein
MCAATHTAPLSTDGIDINGWSLPMDSEWGDNAPAVELSAWDFAGNYYAHHKGDPDTWYLVGRHSI